MSGELRIKKNPKGVIDIFGSCLEEEKDCILLYIGTGELEQEIKNYAQEKGVADKVKFLGVRKDVRRLMQAADCSVAVILRRPSDCVQSKLRQQVSRVFFQIISVRRQS